MLWIENDLFPISVGTRMLVIVLRLPAEVSARAQQSFLVPKLIAETKEEIQLCVFDVHVFFFFHPS